MQTAVLGAAGLKVTPLAYGTWQFGGDWGPVDEKAAIVVIAAKGGLRMEGDQLVRDAGASPEGMS